MPYPDVSFAKSVRSGATLPDFQDMEELRRWAVGEEQDDIVSVIESVQSWFADAGIVPLRTVYLLPAYDSLWRGSDGKEKRA